MSILSKLKLSNQSRSAMIGSPETRRRKKLLDALELQRQAAEAELNGDLFTYNTHRYVTDPNTGVREKRVVPAKVRPWWWKDLSGTYFLTVKYGNRKLELAKGKATIEVGSRDKLVPVFDELIEAVKAGEFDKMIALATRSRQSSQ